jgi:antitoxin component YwqK of YwqJK toxin-antitoxin module
MEQEIVLLENGGRQEKMYKDGKLIHIVYRDKEWRSHRDDGPSSISYYIETGKLHHEGWHKHGDYIRTKFYDENGELESEDFAIHEGEHFKTYKNGKLVEQEWFRNGLRHRDGIKPAHIMYSDRDGIHQGFIYHDGIRVGEMTWMKGENPDHYSMVSIYKDPVHDSLTFFYDDGTPEIKQFTREDGVEVEQNFYPNGNLKSERLYAKDGDIISDKSFSKWAFFEYTLPDGFFAESDS